MNRPEFANEDVAIPTRIVDDGKVHLPAAPFHRLLRYKNSYYRIIHFEINEWSENQYRLVIKSLQPNEVFHEKVDCPDIDSDKIFIYEKMDFHCFNFNINIPHGTLDIELTHSVNQMLGQVSAA